MSRAVTAGPPLPEPDALVSPIYARLLRMLLQHADIDGARVLAAAGLDWPTLVSDDRRLGRRGSTTRSVVAVLAVVVAVAVVVVPVAAVVPERVHRACTQQGDTHSTLHRRQHPRPHRRQHPCMPPLFEHPPAAVPARVYEATSTGVPSCTQS